MGRYFGLVELTSKAGNFPQGGIHEGETPEQAMYRELYEEVGLKPEQVEILYTSRQWLRYRLPKRLIRREQRPMCVGQKQKWFLLRLKCREEDVDVLHSGHPEFDGWRWVSYWYPVRQVVSFKRDVYRRVMKEFATQAMPFRASGGRQHRRKR